MICSVINLIYILLICNILFIGTYAFCDVKIPDSLFGSLFWLTYNCLSFISNTIILNSVLISLTLDIVGFIKIGTGLISIIFSDKRTYLFLSNEIFELFSLVSLLINLSMNILVDSIITI